jgi:sigma-B regulation protein RsbU (phosphoserine phosphatase)
VDLGTLRQWNYHQKEVALRSGDRLVLFTDGITECANSDGMEFGEEQLLGLVSQNVQLAADELKELILTSTSAYCGGELADDATLIVAAMNC